MDEDDELTHRVVNGGVREFFSRIGVEKAWLKNGLEQQRREVSIYLARLNRLFFGVRGSVLFHQEIMTICLSYAEFCFNMHLKLSLSNSLSLQGFILLMSPLFLM